MPSLTEKIYEEIKKQFKSVRQFSIVTEIPYSTVTSALKHGVGSTGFDTVIKICKTLQINYVADDISVMMNTNAIDMVSKYNKLDEKAQYAINAMVDIEYAKKENLLPDMKLAAFGGVKASVNVVQEAVHNAVFDK